MDTLGHGPIRHQVPRRRHGHESPHPFLWSFTVRGPSDCRRCSPSPNSLPAFATDSNRHGLFANRPTAFLSPPDTVPRPPCWRKRIALAKSQAITIHLKSTQWVVVAPARHNVVGSKVLDAPAQALPANVLSVQGTATHKSKCQVQKDQQNKDGTCALCQDPSWPFGSDACTYLPNVLAPPERASGWGEGGGGAIQWWLPHQDIHSGSRGSHTLTTGTFGDTEARLCAASQATQP